LAGWTSLEIGENGEKKGEKGHPSQEKGDIISILKGFGERGGEKKKESTARRSRVGGKDEFSGVPIPREKKE